MRAIIYGNDIDELVKIGETVALVGFCDEPIIATAVRGHSDIEGSEVYLHVASNQHGSLKMMGQLSSVRISSKELQWRTYE